MVFSATVRQDVDKVNLLCLSEKETE